jgi:LysR family glycine cleavage system transcriptional activator
MNDRLPPLQLLRTFETAARLLSFKDAAEALHVTPSAISHQMKQLEEHLGIDLFSRVNRGLQLTAAGQQYRHEVADALGRLTRSTDDLHRRFGRPALRASILPLMAADLIIPALQSFQTKHPDIELRIETSIQMADFAKSDLDVAIRFGLGDWPGLACEKICNIIGTPVCSPNYAHANKLKEIDDIRHCQLIGLPLEERAWERLAEAAGLQDFKPEHSLFLDSLLSTSRAAEQGLGLAIGLFPLMSPLLQSGRLVAPFPIWVPVPEAYYMVWRPEDSNRPALTAFRDWIRELMGALRMPDAMKGELDSSIADL